MLAALEREEEGVQLRKTAICVLVSASATVLIKVPPAAAQLLGIPPVSVEVPAPLPTRDVPVGVLERKVVEQQSQGFQLGPVQVSPALTASPIYNSNIFATSTNPTSDMVMSLRPELTLNGAPGSWAYRFNAYGQWDDYHTNSTLSNINGGAGLGITAGSDQEVLVESRTGLIYGHQDPATFGPSVQNAAVPYLPAYTIFNQGFTVTHQPGLLGGSLSAGFERDDYQNVVVNGVLLNQTQFNGNAFSISPKLNYLVAPPTSLYIQGDYVRRNYDNGVDNSGTGAIVLGSKFEIRRLFQGNAYAGYRYRNYDSSTIGSVGGFTYGINAAWYATELMTVKISGKQDFQDSPVVGNGVSVANVRTIRGELDYEVLPEVIVAAVLGFENDNYQTGQNDNILAAGGNVTYYLNRNANLSLLYLYSNRSSNQVGFSYDRHQVGLALKLQY